MDSKTGYAPYARPVLDKTGQDPLRQFNFGAFVLPWLWGPWHKKPGLFLLLGPILGIVGCQYYGTHRSAHLLSLICAIATLCGSVQSGYLANRWAGESGRFGSMEELLACQRTWRNWAIATFVLLTTGFAAVLALLIVVLRAMAEGPGPH